MPQSLPEHEATHASEATPELLKELILQPGKQALAVGVTATHTSPHPEQSESLPAAHSLGTQPPENVKLPLSLWGWQ